MTNRDLTTMPLLLFWRTWHTAIRTEHTTITFFGLKTGTAMSTLIEELARIGWHSFFVFKTTLRTLYYRNKLYSFHYVWLSKQFKMHIGRRQ